MKKLIKAMLICLLLALVVWAIIHRRVIAAWLTGSPMPEMPEWHKKCFKRLGICKDCE